MLLTIYKTFDNKFVRTFPIGPHILTFVLNDIYHPSFELEVVDNIAFYPFTLVRDSNRYKKIGSASWSKGFDASAYSQWVEDNFKTHHKVDSKVSKMFYEAKDFPHVSVWGLRDEYDKTTSKSNLKALKKIYRSIDYKIYFPQKLIWSKLYRLFTGKRCTGK